VSPPYAVSPDTLCVAYYASAELSCHLALGWPMPECVLDLCLEFKNLTNGLEMPLAGGKKTGKALLDAVVYFGLDAMSATEKGSMRQLAMRGGPYTEQESAALLDYCEGDVRSLRALYEVMIPRIDLDRAIGLRGRYMKAVARMERTGVPIDTVSLAVLRENWQSIQDHLIRHVDVGYGVFDGTRFKAARFSDYLRHHQITWPRLEHSGRLDLKDLTFKTMSQKYPQLEPLRQLRSTLGEMRLNKLAVGSDGRNRCMLSAFASKTGRNQPSNAKFIFGPAAWMRGLIKPHPGYGVAYIDYEQQEFGIAAALSGDKNMQAAYESGDPYLELAKQADAAPPGATKTTHKTVRDLFKQCVLAVQYVMGEESFANRIGQPVTRAQELLDLHRKTYAGYWKWSETILERFHLRLDISTVFGWTLHIGSKVKFRTAVNFPMQANGAWLAAWQRRTVFGFAPRCTTRF